MSETDRISIQISDPWEIVTEVGDAPLPGRLRSLTASAATVQLDTPLAVQGKTIAQVIATPRHARGDFMKAITPVAAQLMFLTADGTPTFAAIGTLSRP